MIKSVVAASVAAVLVSAGAASAANLVTNGDFQSGNTGFTTAYNYYDWQANGNNPNALWPEGTYTIAPNPIGVHSYWVDISGNPGYNPANDMLIVNGATAQSTTLWQQAITAAAGNYAFSANVMDICCNSTFGNNPNAPSTINFQISTNGGATWTTVATFTTAPGMPAQSGDSGVMQLVKGSFAVGGDFLLRAEDGNTAASGNDFAIDNISVTTAVPEPATWAMMILGVGLVGFAARSRRSAVAAA